MENGEWYFVSRAEYRPIRLRFEEYIREVQKIVKKHDGLTFQYNLIGSGRRKMVTARFGSNKGYDFDYNLEIMSNRDDLSPKEVKDSIREAFRKVLKSTPYNDPEDSTSVLTIKMVNRKESRIEHSFDLAIVEDRDDGLVFIQRNILGHYGYQQRGKRFDDREYLRAIKERRSDGYALVCEEYLKLKNRNRDSNKRSFNLYNEAVMNVYDREVRSTRISDWILDYGLR